jgi:baculoviral IAP repeat-containing protein 2/3
VTNRREHNAASRVCSATSRKVRFGAGALQQTTNPIETAKEKKSFRAKFKNYETIPERRASFNTFPSDEDTNITQLVDVGFFHTGTSDQTQCFVCGLTLFNWGIGLDPLTQHKQFAPDCKYIRKYQRNPKLYMDKTEFPAIIAVMEFGFEQQQTIDIYEQLLLSGRQSPRAADLLESLWNPETLLEEDIYSANTNASTGHTSEDSSDDSDSEEEEASPNITIDLQRHHVLKQQNIKLKEQLKQLERQETCKNGCGLPAGMLNLPCGHLATCIDCVYKNSTCKHCDTLIRGVVRVYTI